MSAWLTVVGIGEDGLAGLGAEARAAVEAARTLVGGARHLALVPETGCERLTWPSPFDALAAEIERRRGTPVCVLASGDPMCYGVGAKLARHFTVADMRVLPHASAFSLAAARLGWSLPDVTTVTVHGRPVENLNRYLQPGRRLLALSADAATPGKAAALLVEAGFGRSIVHVLERLGGPGERTSTHPATGIEGETFADLNLLAIECRAAEGTPWYPLSPGLPDDAFQHDGQLTKQAVRAATLAALHPAPAQRLWDIGAGSGSIGIEWMRLDPTNHAVAFENHAGRAAAIRRNAMHLGTPGLEVVEQAAPAALDARDDTPDAIFVGGGLTSADLLESCWRHLGAGGRLVANAVSLEGEQELTRWHQRAGGTLTRIAVSHAAPVGEFRAMRPSLPVTQWAITRAGT